MSDYVSKTDLSMCLSVFYVGRVSVAHLCWCWCRLARSTCWTAESVRPQRARPPLQERAALPAARTHLNNTTTFLTIYTTDCFRTKTPVYIHGVPWPQRVTLVHAYMSVGGWGGDGMVGSLWLLSSFCGPWSGRLSLPWADRQRQKAWAERVHQMIEAGVWGSSRSGFSGVPGLFPGPLEAPAELVWLGELTLTHFCW